jgi:hypothetical protein
MKYIKMVWNDIRKGENIDLYLTVILAISLTILSLVGFASNSLLPPLTLAVLALLSIASLVNRHQTNTLFERLEKIIGSFDVFPNQIKTNEFLTSYLRSKNIHVKKARFIEYSSDNIRPVIQELLEDGTDVHLLMQHPDSAISDYQKNKILQKMQGTHFDFSSSSGSLTMDYYKDIASIRGRVFDNELICVGWYTYDRRDNEKNEPEVWGHNNPTIVIESTDKGFSDILGMFDTVFENLLKNSETFECVRQRYAITKKV